MFLSKHQKTSRLIALVIVMMMSVMSLAACGDGSQSGDDLVIENNMAGESGGEKATFLYDNQIEIETIDCFRDGSVRGDDVPESWEYDLMDDDEKAKYEGLDLEFAGSYVQISGLKDEKIQEKINNELFDLFIDNIGTIPPYRGIKVLLGDNPRRDSSVYSYCNMYAMFSYNNILSVYLNGMDVYIAANSKLDGEYIYVPYTATLNIDLNTGDEITLLDLVGSEGGLEVLSGEMGRLIASSNGDESEVYYNYFDDIKLTGKFRGLRADQKFYLTEKGITVVIDAESPEFYTNKDYNTVVLPFISVVNLEKWFDEDENIYEEGAEWSKRFVTPSGDNAYENRIYRDIDDIYTEIAVSVGAGTPDELIEMIKEDGELSDNAIRAKLKLAARRGGYRDFELSELDGSYEKYMSSEVLGNYISVTDHEWTYLFLVDEDGIAYPSVEDIHNVYRLYTLTEKGKLVEVGLEDLFVPGADVETIVKDALRKNLEELYKELKSWSTYEDLKPFGTGDLSQFDEEYIDALYMNITSIGLTSTSVILVFDDDAYTGAARLGMDVYGVYYPVYPEDFYMVNAIDAVAYRDLGCDNLVIFE